MAQTKSKKATTTKAKTAKKAPAATPISAKQYGRNVVAIIDGEKYSRAFNDKPQREKILDSINKYNAKPSDKAKTSILNIMNELEQAKEQKTEKVEEAKKVLKKAPKAKKPAAVQLTAEELIQVREIIKTYKNVVPQSSPRSRGGEY